MYIVRRKKPDADLQSAGSLGTRLAHVTRVDMEGPFTIHTILSHLYCHYSSLVKVVGILAPSCTILNDDDTELYRRMCTTTLVASNKEDAFGSENDSVQVMPIGHIISEVAEQMGSGGAKLLKSSSATHFLTSPEFLRLHERIGDKMVAFLLRDCAIYVPIGINNGYYQVTGTPIYNLFPTSTILVQPDKLVRPTPTWRTKRYKCTHVRKGCKRRASQQGLSHQDDGSTPSGMSHVQHNTGESSSECGPAPKRAKIVTHSTEIDETSCSHILSVTGSEAILTSQTTGVKQISKSKSCTLNASDTAMTHTADHDDISNSHILSITDIETSPHASKHHKISTGVQETVNLHTADCKDLSSLHILSITDIEGVPNPHGNKHQEISTEVSNLSITGSNSQVASNENEQADLYDANKDTVNLENQREGTSEISVHEGVSPVGDFLPSHKRPREQFEELFETATLTKLKWRRKSHTAQRWRQVKGGSRGRRWRRWRRWKKEENWKRRERRKRNQCRKKEENELQTEKNSLLSGLVQQQVPRFRMFYSARAKQGFTKKYILNAIGTGNSGARKLVKVIFEQRKKPLKKQTGRRAADSRLSKRLQHIVPFFQKMIVNHKKCRYGYILDHYCPLPEDLEEGEAEQLSSQSREEYQTQYASSYTSHEQVHKFLRSVLTHLVPAEMWGSAENRATFFTHLRMFVGLRRWEKVSLKQLDQGIKLSHCSWVKCGNQFNLSAVPHFYKWLLWLMTDVVIETIKAFFYVTEHSNHHNHVFYYRKPVWAKLCKMVLEDQSGVVFSPVSEEELTEMLMRGKTLGISKLRLLPKSNGARPIVNLGSKVELPLPIPGRVGQDSVNYQLQDVFHILTYERNNRPEIAGSTCTGFDDIYQKLRDFAVKEKARVAEGGERSPLLFVCTDLTNCFDSILPDKLYQILQHNVLSQDSYLLRRYTTVMMSKGRIRRKFCKAAMKRVRCEPFHHFATDLSQSTFLKDTILTDMVVYPVVNRGKILEILKKHLFGNIVKVGTQYLKQTQGIPQGSRLSALLCGFYYGDMERKYLPKVEQQNGLLMRFVDDFLLITREPEIARQFLTAVTEGIPEYNCKVNPGKTRTNFELLEDGTLRVLNEVQWIGWCGLMVNTQTVDIHYDYSRYTKKNIRDNMTIVRHSKPFHSLLRITREAVRLRCLPVFLDCEMLSKKAVMTNIYQGFLLAAIKFVANVRALSLGKHCRKYTNFFFQIVVQSIQHYYNKAGKIKQFTGTERPRFTIPQPVCMWLGCHAFHTILRRKDHRKHLNFKMLISMIAYKITTLSNKMTIDEIKHCLRVTPLAQSKPLFTIRC